MKQSTKIIFLGLLSSLALIITCIYFKYDMLLDNANSSLSQRLTLDKQGIEMNSTAQIEPKREAFPQLIDTPKGETRVVSTQVTPEEPKTLEVSSLDYKMEKELISIDGKMPILENNDTLKLMLMSRCEVITCDKKILFSPKQVHPKWKELATETIKLFNSEKMETANLKVEGNTIYISGEFVDKASKKKLDAIVKPYLTVYSIKNSTTVKDKKKEVNVVSLHEETPAIKSSVINIPKVDISKTDVENNSMKTVEAKIADILKEKHVNFYKSRAKITQKGRKTLDEIIVILKKQKDIQIEVQGHTDASGRAKINQWISSERAKSVKHYLVKRGLNPKHITAKGFGETRLLLKNRPYNAINRRVEIKIKRR